LRIIILGFRLPIFNFKVVHASLKYQLDPSVLGRVPIPLHSQIVPIGTKIVIDVELADLGPIFVEYVPPELTPREGDFLIVKGAVWCAISLIEENLYN
jgi:hypothetical protein